MDSGAAVSLIHLQAYKLMLDTLKTAITLPGELETLTTADGSPMHIIGHATITLHLKNLRVTHHFIVVESLMTDVILGIDFQKEYRISYDWDKEKRCYIRHKGQFLCYTCHGLKIRVFYFLYISQIFKMNWISFMATQVNAVLLIH